MADDISPIDPNYNKAIQAESTVVAGESVNVKANPSTGALVNELSAASAMLYSQYAASLADGAEMDSGWLDLAGVDKIQFSGLASAAGMTVNISSRADDNQTALQTPVTYTAGTFYLFNVLARQRYMRFQWQNNTGSEVTNVSMELKGSYGSSDKLSVFPVNVNPSDFSQAALMQSIIKGQQPDGDYVNTPADGEAFNTTSLLTASSTFTSAWTDTDGWNSIEIFIATDQLSGQKGIEVQFTDDTQAGTPTVRSSKFYEFKSTDVARGFATIRLNPELDGFRVKYTNGATDQTAFYLSATLKTNSDNTRFNDGGAITTADFLTEVALGNVDNYFIDTKFGRNPEIDTTSDPEDVWSGGGDYTGHPASFTPETVDVFSSSTSDTAAGTGARTVRIFGLKSNTSTEYESEDLTMNGTSAVTSTNTWWRINRISVLTAGSNGANVGTITARSTTTTANVFAIVQIGFNQTTVAAYTVPASKTMVIKQIRCAITRASGAAGSATLSLRVRNNGSVYQSKRVYEVQTGDAVVETPQGGIVVSAGSDIKVRVDQVSDNDTIAEASFEYILLDV